MEELENRISRIKNNQKFGTLVHLGLVCKLSQILLLELIIHNKKLIFELSA